MARIRFHPLTMNANPMWAPRLIDSGWQPVKVAVGDHFFEESSGQMNVEKSIVGHGFVEPWQVDLPRDFRLNLPNKPPVESPSAGTPTPATNRGGLFLGAASEQTGFDSRCVHHLQAVKGRNTCDGATPGATPTNRGHFLRRQSHRRNPMAPR